MSALKVTLAVAHYDRHMPFVDRTVGLEGAELVVKEVGQSIPGRDGDDRHGRMLNDAEFEAAEVSLSSYLMAKERGAPFTAIPVVPRRLFCQSLFFVRSDSALRGPRDLEGKRVGINTYQTTLSVLAKGDLEHEYGVPWESITWVINAAETLAFEPPAGVRLERAPAGRKIDQMLLAGEIDAAVMPHPPSSLIANRDRVRRLFQDARQAEEDYYRKNGYWPVMHLVAIRQDITQQHPWLPRALFEAFEQAKRKALWHWEDPNWSTLAWGRHYLEEEAVRMGGDPWPNGVARNRANLERFMVYSQEQGLTKRSLSMDELFDESVLDT
ncbi:MAG TPA: 4,5-dihydroxyphthalate decarboxylase [Chloroflexota bacterium]|nr:4,5-dihydroxyphthalate decarboxylase [Chloroflexota bacterium]